MILDDFINKRLLVVVAHQDDESLYFGGLLSSIAHRTEISLVSTTAPMAERPDTHFRLGNFFRVGQVLGCKQVECFGFCDCGPRGSAYPADWLADEIAARLPLMGTEYDFVLTHNSFGEPNKVYGRTGHQAHRATHLGVMNAMRQPIIVSGIGYNERSFEIEYDTKNKKALLDLYAPWWSPVDYEFAYLPERYVLDRPAA